MRFLEVSGISLQEESLRVLQPINFSQHQFQKIAIAGETGSGKSTLLQIIAGLIQPSSGVVTFKGNKVIGPQDQLIPGHPGIAYLSQQFELAAFLRVEQVLKYANKLSEKEAKSLFKVCRIEYLLTRKTSQLSGGERQRIAMARLLLGAPQLFLLDEPFSNLDMGHKNILKEVIRDLGEKLGITVALISHDPLDTLSWADKIMVMRAGKIIQQGTPEKIYKTPNNTYVAGLFGNYSVLPINQAQSIFENIPTKTKKRFLLLRPEEIKIAFGINGKATGLVQSISYFGGYSELKVLVQNTLLKVRTESSEFKVDDPVILSIPDTNYCFV